MNLMCNKGHFRARVPFRLSKRGGRSYSQGPWDWRPGFTELWRYACAATHFIPKRPSHSQAQKPELSSQSCVSLQLDGGGRFVALGSAISPGRRWGSVQFAVLAVIARGPLLGEPWILHARRLNSLTKGKVVAKADLKGAPGIRGKLCQVVISFVEGFHPAVNDIFRKIGIKIEKLLTVS